MAVVDRLDFGMLATGAMVSVKDVANGLGCGCICAECRAPLIARQGALRRWHFSHAPGYVACETGAETALHRMAKQIIAQWNGLTLPPLEVEVARRSTVGQIVARKATIPGAHFVVSTGFVEARHEGFVPDVLLNGPNGESLAVEVCVTHKVSRTKLQRVAEQMLPMIQYSIAPACHWTGGTLELEQHLRATIPEWIFHPQEAELRLRLETELEAACEQLSREKLDRKPQVVAVPSDEPRSHSEETEDRRNSSRGLGPDRGQQEFDFMGCRVLVSVTAVVAVWVVTPSIVQQRKVLGLITSDAEGNGLSVTDPVHTAQHSVAVCRGVEVRKWADGLVRFFSRSTHKNVTTQECES